MIKNFTVPTPKKSKPSDEAVYIPEYWANLESYLNKSGWYNKKILDDGFCLLSFILACMKNYHQIDITIDNAKQLILEQLIDNHDVHMKFQPFNKQNEGDRCTDSDVLV